MGSARRCFESVEALQGRHPQVLRDLLALPEFAAVHKLPLPATATAETLDCRAIHAALMSNHVPEDLSDILYLSSLLGTVKGWSMLERQLGEDKRERPASSPDHSYVDLAVLAAIEKWPRHKRFLERAHARVRVHSKASYLYFAPTLDLRGKWRDPTAAQIEEARLELCRHYVADGLVDESEQDKATEIVVYPFKNEIWCLVRYPGRSARQSGFRGGAWRNFQFNPEQYDAVAYNKVYGDLRMNTKRKTEHGRYRMTFSRLLLGQSGGFREDESEVVTLDPLLRADAVNLFNCDDVPGLAMIVPVDLTYETFGLPPRMKSVKAMDGGSLWEANEWAPRILPNDAQWPRKAVFVYRLKDSSRLSRLIVDDGGKVTYERDGDSVVVEVWLRQREFVKTFVEVPKHVSDDVAENRIASARA